MMFIWGDVLGSLLGGVSFFSVYTIPSLLRILQYSGFGQGGGGGGGVESFGASKVLGNGFI